MIRQIQKTVIIRSIGTMSPTEHAGDAEVSLLRKLWSGVLENEGICLLCAANGWASGIMEEGYE